jgi:dihydropteroate synthase
MPQVTPFSPKFTLNLGGKLLDLSRPVVMGILNVTPDSFFADSRVPTVERALRQAEQMHREGATLLDIGGYSTRPGAADVPVAEELDRILPVIERLRQEWGSEVLISIDTFRASVAEAAVRAGAVMVNDVSGGNLDAAMYETVARLRVPYVLMHSRGNPQTMQGLAQYTDLVLEVVDELRSKVAALRALGVADIVIDPGLGFAKTAAHNFELLRRLEALRVFDLPLLVGVSRKSMIWKTLQVPPSEALNGTTALNAIALWQGAAILRVHDVRPAVETIKLMERLMYEGTSTD